MTFPRPDHESGEKFTLTVEGLAYRVVLPLVSLPVEGGFLRIASLDLIGQTRLNRDMGALLAEKLKPFVAGKNRVTMLTAVEKGLQLAQVVASQLGLEEIAVAHNRIKPHMEASKRPVVRAGVDSLTSGDKFLALYERSLSILAEAQDGVILFDDVISTGSTMMAMQQLLEACSRYARVPVPPVLAQACAAVEGECALEPLVALATLPKPVFTAS